MEQAETKMRSEFISKYRDLFAIVRDGKLLSNAGWLYLSSAIMSAFGAAFWIIAARLASPEVVGGSMFILNVVEAMAIFSLLGINSTVVREWNGVKDKGKYFGSALLVIWAMSLVILFPYFFLAGAQYSWGIILAVAFFVLVLDFNAMLDSVYIAELKPKLLLVRNIGHAVLKVGLVYFLILVSPNSGIVYTCILAMALGTLALCLYTRKSGLFPTGVSLQALRMLLRKWRFALSNYVLHSFDHLWLSLLPVLVILWVGKAGGGYFYIPWYMSCQLVFIANAVAMSLFAEGSANEVDLAANIEKIKKLLKYALIPLALLGALLGRYLLYLFGGDYYEQGGFVLSLLFVACIPFVIISIFKAVSRVKRMTLEISLIWTVLITLTLIPSFILVPTHGVVALGYSWLGANSLVACYALFRMGRMGIRIL